MAVAAFAAGCAPAPPETIMLERPTVPSVSSAPLEVRAPRETPHDWMIVLDVSGSMNAIFGAGPATRFVVAKETARRIASSSREGAIGLVVAGAEAHVMSPPTRDTASVLAVLDRVRFGDVDPNATDLSEAILIAAHTLERGSRGGEEVVLSDGNVVRGDGDRAELASSAVRTARVVHDLGVRVSFVQLADRDEATIQDGVDLFNKPHFVTVEMPIAIDFLETIARESGGARIVAATPSAIDAALDRLSPPSR